MKHNNGNSLYMHACMEALEGNCCDNPIDSRAQLIVCTRFRPVGDYCFQLSASYIYIIGHLILAEVKQKWIVAR